ncbi:MAG: hypothetical protein AB8G22_08995 [Saprospiraceae bacterium]
MVKDYRIILNPAKDEIHVYQRKPNDEELLVKKIYKTKNRLYILNRNNYGKEIQVTDNQLIVRINKKPSLTLEVVER